MSKPKELTRLLQDWSNGEEDALNQLIPMVEAELRRIARYHMRGERINHTLQPTALINEAFLRLIDYKNMRWQDRNHFYAMCAGLMRRILVDYARKRRADKRGGGAAQIPLDEAIASVEEKNVDIIALDEALTKLDSAAPRKAEVVMLRYFAGFTMEEIAEQLNVAVDTVRLDWNAAKAWLYHELNRGSHDRSE